MRTKDIEIFQSSGRDIPVYIHMSYIKTGVCMFSYSMHIYLNDNHYAELSFHPDDKLAHVGLYL